MIGPDGRVAMVCNRNGSWGFPKGKIEPGEDARTAAVREVHEETGIDEIEVIGELSTYERPSKDGGSKRMTIFLMRTQRTELDPLVTDNTAHWMTVEQARETMTHHKDRGLLERVPKG